MAGPNKLALQLNSEIAAVITAMRQNAKWAMVPGKYSVSSASLAFCSPDAAVEELTRVYGRVGGGPHGSRATL